MTNKKIVAVTAGGHVSCFHSAMIGMVAGLMGDEEKFELWGAHGGLEGFINEKFVPIVTREIDSQRAGSMIGADRRNIKDEELSRVPEIMEKNNIYAVVMMGGDNHQGQAAKMHKAGIRIVGWPKTMDGDLNSGVTLGYNTAVNVGVRRAREHYASAITNRRIFYVGLFGRNTDWVLGAVNAYSGGIAIPCEKEYEWDEVYEKIKKEVNENKERYGIGFAVVPYSEGAKIKGIKEPPKEHQKKDPHGLPKLRPEWIGMELERLTELSGGKAAFQAHTYDMRDGPPTRTDEVLAKVAGIECINMIEEGDFGKCVAFEPNKNYYKVVRKPLEEVAEQRMFMPTGYFDYENLKSTGKFVEDYGRLFYRELGNPPSMDDLVYKNMRK